MKTRNGFVSNSSSSSFVIIGYKLESGSLADLLKQINPSKYEELVEKAKKEDYEVEDLLYDYAYDNDLVEGLRFMTDGYGDHDYIGYVVCEEKDYHLSSNKLSGQEIFDIMKEVQEKAQMFCLPSLITGSRGC